MILLDTHVWVWFVASPERLSASARRAIEEATQDHSARLSSISCWEVALLVKKGRLELTLDVREWIERATALPFLASVPVDNDIALRAVWLSDSLHDDPADRIIVATAQSLDATLVTKDARLRRHRSIDTLW